MEEGDGGWHASVYISTVRQEAELLKELNSKIGTKAHFRSSLGPGMGQRLRSAALSTTLCLWACPLPSR